TGNRTQPVIELYASRAVSIVTRWLPRCLGHPSDLTARSWMLLAATFAGVAIDNGGTGVAHAVGHSLGSLGKIHHGTAVTLGMGATLDWNIERAPKKYEGLARAIGIPVDEIGRWFSRFIDGLGMERTLGWDVDWAA